MGLKFKMLARISGNKPNRTIVLPQQLPVYPVTPAPGAETLGLISWDLPEMIKYVPLSEVAAYVEMLNPSLETNLYVVSYYFLDLSGLIVDEGFVTFFADSEEFNAFYLPPQGEEPSFFEIIFSASEEDYSFGLRLLLCEMLNGSAKVIQETSRVQVLMASEATYNKYQAPSMMPAIAGILAMGLLIAMVIPMTKQ